MQTLVSYIHMPKNKSHSPQDFRWDNDQSWRDGDDKYLHRWRFAERKDTGDPHPDFPPRAKRREPLKLQLAQLPRLALGPQKSSEAMSEKRAWVVPGIQNSPLGEADFPTEKTSIWFATECQFPTDASERQLSFHIQSVSWRQRTQLSGQLASPAEGCVQSAQMLRQDTHTRRIHKRTWGFTGTCARPRLLREASDWTDENLMKWTVRKIWVVILRQRVLSKRNILSDADDAPLLGSAPWWLWSSWWT